jgi:hypothetical protein
MIIESFNDGNDIENTFLTLCLIEQKNCDTVAVTGEECLQLIPGLVVADYLR